MSNDDDELTYLLILFFSQGIGKSAAELFAREGALVCVTDIDAGLLSFFSDYQCLYKSWEFYYSHFRSVTAKANQVASDINAAGGKAIAIAGNIMDPEFPEQLVEGTVKWVIRFPFFHYLSHKSKIVV